MIRLIWSRPILIRTPFSSAKSGAIVATAGSTVIASTPIIIHWRPGNLKREKA